MAEGRREVYKMIHNGDKVSELKAYVVSDEMKMFTLKLGELTDDEREIILKGCLINYYRD